MCGVRRPRPGWRYTADQKKVVKIQQPSPPICFHACSSLKLQTIYHWGKDGGVGGGEPAHMATPVAGAFNENRCVDNSAEGCSGWSTRSRPPAVLHLSRSIAQPSVRSAAQNGKTTVTEGWSPPALHDGEGRKRPDTLSLFVFNCVFVFVCFSWNTENLLNLGPTGRLKVMDVRFYQHEGLNINWLAMISWVSFSVNGSKMWVLLIFVSSLNM